jgi:hypothetical protein
MPWRDLECTGYTGLELWSFVTDSAEGVTSVRDLLRFIAAPGRFIDHPPKRNLARWDEICRERRCVAIGGVDAHQIGVRVRGRVPLRLMSYRRSFRFLHTHVLAEQPLSRSLEADRKTLFAALRAGRAYIAIDSLAPAKGFRFWAEGDEAGAGTWTLHVRTPRPARLRLLRGGVEVAGGSDIDGLEHRSDESGVYRVEAYLDAHGRERTWILSNPIYLR